MKKLLIMVFIISILNLILLVITVVNIHLNVDVLPINKCDTVINKVRIDSIEYVIKSKDSIIKKIKYDEKRNIEKANELSDTASVELFKQLVSE